MALNYDPGRGIIKLDEAQQYGLGGPDAISQVPEDCADALLEEVYQTVSELQVSARTLERDRAEMVAQGEQNLAGELVEDSVKAGRQLVALWALGDDLITHVADRIADDLNQV